MEFCGLKARVPLGNGKWSPLMSIPDAEKFDHTMRVSRYLEMLRAGKQIIGLRGDIPAMSDAQEQYQAECGVAENNPTSSN